MMLGKLKFTYFPYLLLIFSALISVEIFAHGVDDTTRNFPTE